MNRFTFPRWLMPLVSLTFVGHADPSDYSKPPSLAEAKPWEIAVERKFQFPAAIGNNPIVYSVPTFSHDFRRVLYVVAEPYVAPNNFMEVGWNLSIIIRSLETLDIQKQIPLAGVQFSLPGGSVSSTVAYSPDEKKLVFGPVTLTENKKGLLFVDISSSKLTPIAIDWQLSGSRIVWPDRDYVSLDAELGLNLDTLKPFSLSKEQSTPIKNLQFHNSDNKNCVLELIRSPQGKEIDDRLQPNDLVVSGMSFSKVVVGNFAVGAGANAIGALSLVSALTDLEPGVIWSPDLRYLIFKTEANVSLAHGQSSRPLVLVELGTKMAPVLEYDVKGLKLNDAQRKDVKVAFASKKRIWANIYGRMINPLNEKLLGPNEELLGQGYLTQVDPRIQFRLSFEKPNTFSNTSNPIGNTLSNIISSFMVEGSSGSGWKWSNDTWGELVQTGTGDDSKIAAIQISEAPSASANTGQTGKVETPTAAPPSEPSTDMEFNGSVAEAIKSIERVDASIRAIPSDVATWKTSLTIPQIRDAVVHAARLKGVKLGIAKENELAPTTIILDLRPKTILGTFVEGALYHLMVMGHQMPSGDREVRAQLVMGTSKDFEWWHKAVDAQFSEFKSNLLREMAKAR